MCVCVRQLETRGSKGQLLCNVSNYGQAGGTHNVCGDVCVDVHQRVCTSNGRGAVYFGVLYIWVPATWETKD